MFKYSFSSFFSIQTFLCIKLSQLLITGFTLAEHQPSVASLLIHWVAWWALVIFHEHYTLNLSCSSHGLLVSGRHAVYVCHSRKAHGNWLLYTTKLSVHYNDVSIPLSWGKTGIDHFLHVKVGFGVTVPIFGKWAVYGVASERFSGWHATMSLVWSWMKDPESFGIFHVAGQLIQGSWGRSHDNMGNAGQHKWRSHSWLRMRNTLPAVLWYRAPFEPAVLQKDRQQLIK